MPLDPGVTQPQANPPAYEEIMPKQHKRRNLTPVRYKGARIDASVRSIARRIERDYKLPTGSVALLLRSGRRARRDGTIGALLRHWGW